ncbi:MAG TPA: phenylphosphate carboxylase subunit delta, partial [Bacteroidetes bacterium]|nr:phenylphosphate carboxylase subunit delta [Bacteroidota bacterium]
MKRARSGVVARLKNIRLLLLDVDGVLTDGGVYYS